MTLHQNYLESVKKFTEKYPILRLYPENSNEFERFCTEDVKLFLKSHTIALIEDTLKNLPKEKEYNPIGKDEWEKREIGSKRGWNSAVQTMKNYLQQQLELIQKEQ